MSSKIYSATTFGLDSFLIEVEADILNSSSAFVIVGLPDAAVQEAKERVRSAIKNSGWPWPRTRVAVNLAPADLKKIGPAFDLPIALAILLTKKYLELSLADSSALYVGELSLNGSIRPINGILAIVSLMKKLKLKRLYLPAANAAEAALISCLEIFPLDNLAQLAQHLTGKKFINQQKIKVSFNKTSASTAETFSQIKGQLQAKRALVIAAAGDHNLLMIGPPGSGKTLLARAASELLPQLTLTEALEVTKIYSVAGLLDPAQPLITARPFRSPHHTASSIALVGGGSFPKPGEVTLAHRGILFLDELAEFPRHVLEALRQPLEDRVITVARAAQTLKFPAHFTLITAANPCPCGFLNDPEKDCCCTPLQILRYQKKFSGPLLDRFDLQIMVPRVKFIDLQNNATVAETKSLVKNIATARAIQHRRFTSQGWPKLFTNSEITATNIERLCPLDARSLELLKEAMVKFHLSARGYHRVIKVARTIADLAECENIKVQHLAEALQYRLN